jgi:hypothetical protein
VEAEPEPEAKAESKPVLVAGPLPQAKTGSLVAAPWSLVAAGQPVEAKQEQVAPATNLVAAPLIAAPLIAAPLIAGQLTATTPIITTKPPEPPTPGNRNRPKRNYKSTESGKPLMSVVNDENMKAYTPTVHGEPQSFDFDQTYFTTDQGKIDRLVDRYRAERLDRALQSWGKQSRLTNGYTMPTGKGDDFYILNRNVLVAAMGYAESELIMQPLGQHAEDRTLLLKTANRPGMYTSGMPPQTTGLKTVTYSEIAEHFQMKKLLQNDQPTILRMERYADDNEEENDPHIGTREVRVTDKYEARHVETGSDRYGAIRTVHLDPPDDDD